MKTKLLLLLSLFVISFSYAQIPTNGLIAQYGFDNGQLYVDDINGEDFTHTGSALVETSDRFGNTTTSAVQLNGDYLTRPDITFGNYHSYNFWIKVSSTSTGNKVIIDDSNRTATNSTTWTGTRVTLNSGNVAVSIRYLQSNYIGLTSISTTDVRDDKWHNITLRMSNGQNTTSGSIFGSTEIFVDGVSEDDDDAVWGVQSFPTRINGTGNLTIANDRTNSLTTAEMYDGEIDDILIYDRVLADSEIQNIINDRNYCLTPESSILSVSSITDAEATINISGSGTVYDLAYHKTTEPFSNAMFVTGIASGQANLNNLEALTDYQLYVREQCAVTTNWSLPLDFETIRPTGPVYVDLDATGNNNGASWLHAFNDLQDALAVVVSSDQEIWIAGGRYIPHTSSVSTYFEITEENLKIYGGFVGTETQLSERVLGANETILSGDLQNDDVNDTDYVSNYNNTTRNGVNSYTIININSAGNNLLLDGLTISDAHNTTSSGGAILKDVSVADLTLKNCVVKDNVSVNAAAGLLTSFTLATSVVGNLTIENCEFVNNMARWASGIYSVLTTNNEVNVTVSNSLFDGNLTGDLSTTLTGLSVSSIWFRNSSVNTGTSFNIDVVNSTFVNNIDTGTQQSLNSTTHATLAFSHASTRTSGTYATVANCVFWNNKTVGGVTARSITDLYERSATSVNVVNSLDEASFNDDSISSITATSNADPLFTDLANGDYSLSATSPAIDSGLNSSVNTLTDLKGNARVYNTAVDMGAYESTFGSNNRLLTVNIEGLGSTDVISGTYPDGTITITAIPDAGTIFTGWSGDVSDRTNPLTLTLDENKTITAKFSTIIYVDETATGSNDGSSWTDAYISLQDAIASATSGSIIWIASGTYKAHASSRSTYFNISESDIGIYGGFAGTETQLSERVFGTNETILSGDLQGNDTNISDYPGNYSNTTRNADNSYHIISITATGNNLLLDGLTISDAHTNLTATERGGAIIKEASVSDLTLKNCIIKDNVSRNDNAGLLAEFNLNSTTVVGKLIIENCQFINNMSRWASGLYSFINANSSVEITIANSLFDGNISGDLSTTLTGISGSAMWLRNISGNATSSLNIDIVNSTFVNNLDTGTQQSLSDTTRATVGLSQTSASTTSTNATIANCIFWNNQTTGGVTARSITDLYKSPLNSLSIINSIDEANFNDDSITSTTATSNADPLFTDEANGDFTLSATSPAVDSGDNTYVIGTTDLSGNARIFNTTVDMGAYEYDPSISFDRTLTTTATNGTITADIQPTNGVYANGTVVELTATPDTGYQFDGWSGDATGTTNPLSITMDADKSVTALFSLIQQTLTTTATNGTVTADVQPTNGTYDYGDVVELTATPDTGYQFDGWSGDATGTTNPLSITMDADKSVTAMFSLIQQTLTTVASNGTIVADVSATNGTYDYGEVVELTATPATGYQFDGWSGDASGTTNPLSVTMDADKTVTATFKLIQQTLTTTAVNGTITVDVQPTNGTYADGTVIELTATPATGYQFDGWSGDASGTTNPLSITMDANKNIEALFSVDNTASIVNDVFNRAISTYPNPVANTLTISLATDQAIQKVEVFNLLGKKVIVTTNTTVDFSTVSKGIYLLKIVNTNGEIATRKVIKK